MRFLKKQFNFLKKNKNIKDSIIKSIVFENYIMMPTNQNVGASSLEYQVINHLFKKICKIKLHLKDNKVILKINFLELKISSRKKKQLLKKFIDASFNNLNIDEIYVELKLIEYFKGFNDLLICKEKKIYKITKNKLTNKQILTAGPSISEKEKIYVYDAVENGWNNNWSNYLTRFEQLFSKQVNRKYCLATSSCTGAMHIALLALGIKKGDEVIVPDITWVATASVVEAVGAIPVFADVNIDDWTIDINSIKKLISKKQRQ